MNERVNAYLDGELAREELRLEERAEAAALEAAVADVRRALDATFRGGMDARVMRRIAELEGANQSRPGLVRRALGALLAPREVRLQWRPVYALAAAATLALLLASPWSPGRRDSSPAAAENGSAGRSAPVFVQFRLQVESATSVALAGSFTGWQPAHALQQSADGVWTVVVPITPGVHDYVFVVDGERWLPDPYAPQVDDGFGGTNSRLTLLTPAAL
jgi:hypothetical protein